jgi:hypothetical protein
MPTSACCDCCTLWLLVFLIVLLTYIIPSDVGSFGSLWVGPKRKQNIKGVVRWVCVVEVGWFLVFLGWG